MKLILLFVFISVGGVASEDFSRQGVKAKLDLISTESEQIDFILENFYKIYSQDFQVAIDFTDQARKVAIENQWKDKEGFCLLNSGVANYLKGNYEIALTHLLKASHIFDSLAHKKGIASVNNELAVFYNRQRDSLNIYKSLDKSELAARQIGDSTALCTSLHHRGSFLMRRGQYDEAKSYFDKVLKIRRLTYDSVGLGYVLLDMAEYEVSKGNLPKAIHYIDESTEIRTLTNDRQGVAVNQVIIGEAYFNSEQYKTSILYFEKGIEQATEIGYTDLIQFAYNMVQQAELKLGNYKAAYESLIKSKTIQDSLYTIEKTKAIAELQTKYETDKKEQQIELQKALIAEKESKLLQNQLLSGGLGAIFLFTLLIGVLLFNRQRLKQEKQLEQAKAIAREAQIEAALNSQENERRRFARDIHDGFGQMISVLNLNLKSLEMGSSDRETVFENSSKVLADMYKELKGICFNLMPETLIRNGVVDALKEFSTRISMSGRLTVDMHTFGIEGRLKDVQEINLYRITQEWVNNILKYSDAKHVTIQLTKDETEITLTIEDDGAGFDKTVLMQGNGNGWKNIQSRANLIKGEVELDTLQGRKGTTFIMNAVHNSSPVEVRLG